MEAQAIPFLLNEKPGTLMLKCAVPYVISLLVSALYKIVDQIFIGRGIGYLGNEATSVVFPLTVIALAIGVMIGDACCAKLARQMLCPTCHSNIAFAIHIAHG